MADEHAHEAAHGPSLQAYLYVFGALCICTSISFIVNQFFEGEHQFTGAAIIMAVAVVKATLVAGIFMHLKFDIGKLYCIILPVCIVTLMMVIILSIDTTLAWHAYPTSGVPLIK